MSDYHILNTKEQRKEILKNNDYQTPSFIDVIMQGQHRVFDERDKIDILTPEIADKYDVEIDMDKDGRFLKGHCNYEYKLTHNECGLPTMLVKGDFNDNGETEVIKYCEENFGLLNLSVVEEIYILPAQYPLNSLEDVYYNYESVTTSHINIYHLTEETVQDLAPMIYLSFSDHKFDNKEIYEVNDDLKPKIYNQLNTQPELEEGEIYMIHNYTLNYATYIKINNIDSSGDEIILDEQKLSQEKITNKFDIDKSKLLGNIL